MAKALERTWAGGVIRKDARGRDCYVLRKQYHGRRYKISLRTHSERTALRLLDRFESDPINFRVEGSATKKAIYLDAALALEFLEWSRDVQKNTPKWVNEQRGYLAWWSERLDGCDLRGLSLTDRILPELEGVPARAPKIAVLKRLYSYLRKVRHEITLAEDPTFQQLSVPQTRPAQWKKSKTIPVEHVQLALAHLTGPYRDGLEILAGCGCHVSELVRFAAAGSVEPHPDPREAAGVLVFPQTKGGSPLRVAVSSRVFKAGERLRERGALNRKNFDQAVKAACRAAKIATFTPGRMRAAVASHAIAKGADMAQVATFLHHKSPRTTARYYATHATPKRVPTLR